METDIRQTKEGPFMGGRGLENHDDGGYCQQTSNDSHETALGRRSGADGTSRICDGGVAGSRLRVGVGVGRCGGNSESGTTYRTGGSRRRRGCCRAGGSDALLDGELSGPGFVAGGVFDGNDDFGSGSDAGVRPVIPGVVGLRELDQGIVAGVVTWDDGDVIGSFAVLPGKSNFLTLDYSFGSVDGDILGDGGDGEGGDSEDSGQHGEIGSS
jgi:hypothetical protein